MKRKLLSALLATAMTMTVVAGTGIAVSADGEAVVSTVMFSDPDTMDPGRADDDQKNSIILECQESLVRLIDGKLTNAGAESYETSEDGLTWTFHLRDNKYSDGTPVVAADYVNSIRRVFDPEVNCHNAGIFYCIAGGEAFNTGSGAKEDVGAKAVDDKTLEITSDFCKHHSGSRIKNRGREQLFLWCDRRRSGTEWSVLHFRVDPWFQGCSEKEPELLGC